MIMDETQKKPKGLDELANLVSKSFSQVIRFSSNQNFRESCLTLLNVENSFEAERALRNQFNKWTFRVKVNDTVELQSGENAGQKRKSENQLPGREINQIINDLDDWV